MHTNVLFLQGKYKIKSSKVTIEQTQGFISFVRLFVGSKAWGLAALST